MTDDTLISFGGAVKSLGGGRVGGYLIRFTSPGEPDLTGEYFTADTDYWIEPGETPTKSVIYHHGFDPTLGIRKIGKAVLRKDQAGWWAEAQLDLRDEYERKIEAMAKAGKLGWSSGSATHLYKTNRVGAAKHITSWPIVEATLTPIPADFHAGVIPLKSWKTMTEGEDDMDEPDTRPIEVGSHVKHKDGCGEVKALFTGGEHETKSVDCGTMKAESAHFINKCSCGEVISQCRCTSRNKTIRVIENGCKDCREKALAAGKCMATKDAPMAHVDMHDKDHGCTGAVKCYPVKDLGAMDGDDEDEASAKALDRYVRGGAVSAPFLDHSREVVSAVGGFVERVRGRLDARVKAGRELSAANRSEIDTVCSALESGVEKLRAILDRTAPQPDATTPGEGGKSIDPKVLLRLRAELISTDQFLIEHAH